MYILKNNFEINYKEIIFGIKLCPFKNGKVCPPVTLEAGARWPRRGGVFARRRVSNFQMRTDTKIFF
jgi:hypothetical protein